METACFTRLNRRGVRHAIRVTEAVFIGRLQEIRGDTTAATEEYRAALALDPKIRDAVARVRGLGGGV